MHPLALTKRVLRFPVTHVVLFTLAFLLTIIPNTFASQPQTNSPTGFHNQTTKFSTTTPQQLVSQAEALYQAGRFTEAVNVLQQAVRIYQQEGNNLAQAAALTGATRFGEVGSKTSDR